MIHVCGWEGEGSFCARRPRDAVGVLLLVLINCVWVKVGEVAPGEPVDGLKERHFIY